MKQKRLWLLLVCMMALLSAAAGCGSRHEREEAERAEREKIVLWSYYETDAQMEALNELVRGFNLSQNVYEASWEYVPMTDFTKRLTMAYTENALPDMALIDNPDMPACIRTGMFEDITEFLQKRKVEEEYYSSLLQTVTYDGRLYGIPFNCNNVGLIYKKDVLQEAGIGAPPATWEELEKVAARLTKGEQKGFLMSAMEGEQGAFQILPWILSAGENHHTIGGAKTVEAFEFLGRLVEEGYMTGDCINLSQTDVARMFVQGKAAMMENGPWVLPMLEEAGIDYGVSPLPARERNSVIAGGENLGILKGKNVEGAQAFFDYCMQDKVMLAFCSQSCVLPVKKNLELSDGEKFAGMSVFQEQMEQAVMRTSLPAWNSLSHTLSEAMYYMVAGEMDAAQAADFLRRD